MRPEIIVKAAIQKTNGHILLMRRSATDTHRPLKWDLPGGRVDGHEDPHEAVVREIREETGLAISDSDLKKVYENTQAKDEQEIQRQYYVGMSNDDQITLSYEHDQYRWLSLDEAIAANDHPVQKAFLQFVKDKNMLLVVE